MTLRNCQAKPAMKATIPAIMIDPEPTAAPAPTAPSVPNIREMRNGAAIGRTSIAATQITDAANAATIPARALLI